MNPSNELPRDLTLSASITALATEDDGPRRFTARLLTYGEETRDYRKLTFAPGSVVPTENVPVAYAHQTSGMFGSPVIIGRSLKFWEEGNAPFGEFEISTTPDADEIWTLISDGSLSKVSIGGQIAKYEMDVDTDAVTVLSFDVAEVSVVPVPAMKSAAIVQNQPDSQLVTLAQEGATNVDPETTLTPAPAPEDMESRLLTVEEFMRTQTAPEPIPTPAPTGSARGGQFRNLGELFSTVALMDQGAKAAQFGDVGAARDSLGALLENGHLYFSPDGTRMVDVFAFEDAVVADTGTVSTVQDDLLTLLRDGRVISEHFAKGDLDTVPGAVVTSRKQTEQALVDYQGTAENTAVASNKNEVTTETFNKVTLAGGQGVSIQARDWSQPSYMQEVVEDLVSAYGEKLNYEVVNGDDGSAPTTIDGIINAGPAALNAGGASAAAIAKAFVLQIGLAKGASFAAGKRWPGKIFANGNTWGVIDGWTDADGRPLLATDSMGTDVIGANSGPSPVGKIRGLIAYADDAIADEAAIVSSFRDAKLWESKGAPVQVGLTYPDVLTIDVAVYGYSAVAIRRPNVFQIIDHIGVAAA